MPLVYDPPRILLLLPYRMVCPAPSRCRASKGPLFATFALVNSYWDNSFDGANSVRQEMAVFVACARHSPTPLEKSWRTRSCYLVSQQFYDRAVWLYRLPLLEPRHLGPRRSLSTDLEITFLNLVSSC